MLKSLADHNAERDLEYRRQRDEALRPKLNGIACPTCGAELTDNRPYETFTNGLGSFTCVYCHACTYRGTRAL